MSNPQQPPPYPPQHSGDYASYPQVNQHDANPTWGTPVMGTPANPSAHPDNQHAATGAFDGAGVVRQSSGPYDVKQSQSQPASTTSGTAPSGQGPYVQSTETPAGQKGTMDKFVGQVNLMGKKVELVAGNVWSHLTAGSSVAESAWGKMSTGARVLTEGGFEKIFKTTFPVDADEVLKKTYACYLSTSTGPVAGTLYVSSKKFAFSSDRPLSYTPAPGQQAFSYYKVIIPLDRVKEVKPFTSQNKPAEKYIQVNTLDNYEFWFMGFVNYDKGVTNMQAALSNRAATGSQTAGAPYQQPPTGAPYQQPPTGAPYQQPPSQQNTHYPPPPQGHNQPYPT